MQRVIFSHLYEKATLQQAGMKRNIFISECDSLHEMMWMNGGDFDRPVDRELEEKIEIC